MRLTSFRNDICKSLKLTRSISWRNVRLVEVGHLLPEVGLRSEFYEAEGCKNKERKRGETREGERRRRLFFRVADLSYKMCSPPVGNSHIDLDSKFLYIPNTLNSELTISLSFLQALAPKS